MLTRKQHELLMFIHKRLEEGGVSPSFDEMKEALNLKSKSGIHRLITALEERGFIRRLPHRARALEVLKLPEVAGAATAAEPSPAIRGFAPNVIPGNFPMRSGGREQPSDSDGGFELPLYGRIAAGTAIEAISDPTSTVSVPLSMVAGGEHYALEIAGDSMIEDGIFDGDTVIIRRCDTAENGSIVVALIDEREATLKRLRRKGNSVALEPANAAYKIQIFGPDRVRIQGRLVGLIRNY
ncbi:MULTISPECIES: transcriptional repressor LexA [Thalassobaculum]|uniref:LexA repressor n=1 Tax=Thalassobaculum litoreum DSM 18839 TaxID=1123362 RepID=A0A8G2BLD7_9PROT|nr:MULTISPECIES: transcriptional repressor LexA [Thalassobaculum]SDG38802.1 SOS-response transcriptional repressor, LexA [Thalassobaculum litoreum DSM 18839]